MSALTKPEVTLARIDDKLDELDSLIHDLGIPNAADHCTKLYELYAALETAVEAL